MNVILIVSDTLRRDHLGCYGNRVVRTPNLDRFAKKCVVFDRNYVSSFPTIPMRADLFTGKSTFTYLGWAPLPSDEVVLSQVLGDAGYRTMAIVDTPFLMREGFGYDRGFQVFNWLRGQAWPDREDVTYERRYEEDCFAPRTGAHAERWLERHYKEKFFLYIDTWDPHEPWDPPAHYVKHYYPQWDGKTVPPLYHYWKKKGMTRKQIDVVRACYAGEVTMVDRMVGRIIERLESLDILDETLIIFTSDHGYHFGEHGLFGKTIHEGQKTVGAPLYEEVTRVPLLVHLPGAKPGRSQAMVCAPDIMPTILELLKLKIPDTVQGTSVAPIIKGQGGTGRRFAVSTMPLYNPGHITRAVDALERRVTKHLQATITYKHWTMLYACEGMPVELYNLKTDPGQKKNVAKGNPEMVRKMHRMFFNFIKDRGASEELLAPRAKL